MNRKKDNIVRKLKQRIAANESVNPGQVVKDQNRLNTLMSTGKR